jgi:hypothetical protein
MLGGVANWVFGRPPIKGNLQFLQVDLQFIHFDVFTVSFSPPPRRGTTLVRDSLASKWIYILKSVSSC